MPDDDLVEWSAATSLPGETLTPSGRLRAGAVGLRNLRNDDARYVAHKRRMMRSGLVVLAIGAAFVGAVSALWALLLAL